MVWVGLPSRLEAEAVETTLQGITPLRLLVTGVGALASLQALWQAWVTAEAQPVALVVLGIAGSYDRRLAPSKPVYVQRERWGDVGKRYGRRFEPTPEALRHRFPLYYESSPPPPEWPFPCVEGLTLHTVSGSRREARFWRRQFPTAQIETQENVAYFIFAQAQGIPLYALRVISNFAGARRWEKALALAQLHELAQTYVAPFCRKLLAGSPPT
ncbi:MAG: hypothetical protein NZ958_06965 [Bacteroidia bacterium]|nr:hypothetical protein [Bacteroidia bacterium]MDW8089439.1 hypothetical protein [Bacteroidia bacterium]